MKKRTLVFFSFISAINLNAQEVLSTQGESYSNANGSIDFTIGETVINTATNGVNTLTQGFHQSNWNFVSLDDQAPEIVATVFPNPMDADLIVKVEQFENLSYSLFDGQGKLVITDDLVAETTLIKVDELAAGNYSITLNSESSPLKTFKLIKTQ